MTREWRPRLVAGLLVGLGLSGCQQAAQGPAAQRDLSSPRMHTMPVGTVQVVPAAEAAVRINVSGLQPSSKHPIWLGAPGCAIAGKRLAGTTLDADETGKGTAEVGPGLLAAGVAGGLVLGVGPGAQETAEAAPLACADLLATGSSALLPAPAFSGARVTVDMAYERTTRILTVHVRATGLEPGTRHPNHIHTGQCESEGPVREVLHTLVADAQGHADVVTPIPQSDGIRPGAWYVAVHTGPRLESQAQYALLSCGNVATVSTVTN